MMSAVLSNPSHPKYGVATIPFPIPRDQYAHCMELLEALEIGDAVKADCKVEKIDSFYTVLKRTEMLTVNVEELKLAEDLPELCFSTLPGTGELICIKRGVSGYYHSDWSTDNPAQNRELADYNNERLGVTQAQRLAMECGSIHGWSVPGADPSYYEQKMGGMKFG